MGLKDVQKIARDIKSLKIQGAGNVAKASFKSLSKLARYSDAKTRISYFNELEKARKILISTRATEPAMRNVLNYLINNLKNTKMKEVSEIKKLANKISRPFLKNVEKERENLARYGSKLIGKRYKVFTHCHSSTVRDILLTAKKRISFEVYNTETRPRFQGRTTAKELAKAKIPVTHFVDNAFSHYIKHCDIMMIGADAILADGRVANKLGSKLFAEVASNYDIPVYVCATTWKFNPETIFGEKEKIEQRDPKEVWKNAPKSVRVMNPAFDLIDPDHITGIVCEFGIYTPENFVREIGERRPYFLTKHL